MKWRDPEEARTKLFELATSTAGYFTAKQALEAGYSRRLQHYHAKRGHWLRIDRGIYRLRDFPGSPFEDLVRWTLWSRGKAVVSHETAAAVHELGDVLPGRIHLTVDPEFRKAVPPGVALHKAHLGVRDIGEGAGFRISTPLRTIVDLIDSPIEMDRLVGVVRDALTRGAVRRPALEAEVAGLTGESRSRAESLMAHVGDLQHAL